MSLQETNQGKSETAGVGGAGSRSRTEGRTHPDQFTGRASREDGGYRHLSDRVCWGEKIFTIDSLQRKGRYTVKVFVSDSKLQINNVAQIGWASSWRSAFSVISRLDRHNCQLESSFRYNLNTFFLKTFLKAFTIQGRNYRGVQDKRIFKLWNCTQRTFNCIISNSGAKSKINKRRPGNWFS